MFSTATTHHMVTANRFLSATMLETSSWYGPWLSLVKKLHLAFMLAVSYTVSMFCLVSMCRQPITNQAAQDGHNNNRRGTDSECENSERVVLQASLPIAS